ncbi:MAG: response regulator [Geobacteraceae bacterium]|nr:response regulator [Geobacteraceae bacterium]
MNKVLIVDDSKTAQIVLSSILEAEYFVEVMDDAASAITAVETSPPDLILLDVNMPGMDGFELCKFLKESNHSRDIPVIFITALDSEIEKVMGFESGGDDYVVKPVYPLELLARVKAHLGARKARLDAVAMERMIVFKEMAVALCHEINNPLTTVNAYLYLLQRDLPENGVQINEIVAGLTAEIARISDITSRLSDATSASTITYNRGIKMIDLQRQGQ